MASGNPIELGVNIAGVNATQRLLGTDPGGNAGGLQPRLRVGGDPKGGSGQSRIANRMRDPRIVQLGIKLYF